MTQLDASAIKEVRDLALTSALGGDFNNIQFGAVALPDNFKIHSLEKFNEHRDRFRGCLSTTSISDFSTYTKTHGKSNAFGTSCFIDADNMKAVSVFNLGDIQLAGHADDTATIKLKRTAPFEALLSIDGKKNRQKELAEWLEDWCDYLLAFDENGEQLDIKKAAGAVRRITIESIRSSDHEDHDFSAKRSVMESVEARSKEIMPAAFEFSCIPYEGLSARRFKLRYSIISSDSPVCVLRIAQLETAEEEMAVEFRDLLVNNFTGTDIETYIGSFTA